MTDRSRQGRRLAALAVVPLSAGVLGTGVAWAGSHDPLAAATPEPTTPAPSPTATSDPRVDQLLAEVEQARQRISELQATLDARAAAAADAAAKAQADAAAKAQAAAAAKAPCRRQGPRGPEADDDRVQACAGSQARAGPQAADHDQELRMSAPVAARTLTSTFRSMASDIELRVVDPGPGADRAIERAVARIEAVARHLTRFDAGSALSRANASPAAWHEVPVELAAAVDEAARAHRETGGLFDPRVLDALLAWGYDRTFAQVAGASVVADTGSQDPAALPGVPDGHGATARPAPAAPWQPTVLPGGDASRGGLLNLGGTPIDLGGIGKGLAVRWAAAELDGAGASVLVDAGGDEWLGGPGPDGEGWLVGVEDPFGQGE